MWSPGQSLMSVRRAVGDGFVILRTVSCTAAAHHVFVRLVRTACPSNREAERIRFASSGLAYATAADGVGVRSQMCSPAEDAALVSALAGETKRSETRPMTRRSRLLLVVILGGIGLAAGLSLALGHPSKYGPAHSCPAGASRSACTYPPALGLQRTEWSAAGLLMGLT